jgi:hypothetical protein
MAAPIGAAPRVALGLTIRKNALPGIVGTVAVVLFDPSVGAGDEFGVFQHCVVGGEASGVDEDDG